MKASTEFPYHPLCLGLKSLQWTHQPSSWAAWTQQVTEERSFGRQSRLGTKTCWAGIKPGCQRSVSTHFVKLRCSRGCCGMGGQEGPESWGHRKAELQGATTPCPHGVAGLLLPLSASLGQGSLPPMAGMWETSAWFMDKSVSISKRSDDFQVSCLGRETKWLSVINNLKLCLL